LEVPASRRYRYITGWHKDCWSESDPWQSIEKAIHGFFNIAIRKTWFSNGTHFQGLTAIENVGTSLCRTQLAEKYSFSTSC
jgi:hypothetical protein